MSEPVFLNDFIKNSQKTLSKARSFSRPGPKQELSLSKYPYEVKEETHNSMISKKEPREDFSLTKNKSKKNMGYRTLKYEDLLSRSVDMSKGSSKPLPNQTNQSKLSGLTNKSKFISKNNISNNSSNRSLFLGIGEDLNRNEISQMDISIMSTSKRRSPNKPRKKTTQSKYAIQHYNNTNGSSNKNENLEISIAAGSPQEDEEDEEEEVNEVRENKDLNTTYVQKAEMVGPKKAVRELGVSVVGKRPKINQYVLITMIGKGGWGQVFLGIDVNTKKKYVGLFS